ncbi:hypothetical protein [Yersinia massiliensis]|nr:hypothetical protein [Yersinia massiliensis]MCB5306915.1 hypothetical protein [Yersinia massiliensis]
MPFYSTTQTTKSSTSSTPPESSKSLPLQVGSKQTHPDELTLVSDSGK